MGAEIVRGLSIEAYHSPANGYVSHSRFHDFVKHGPKFYEQRYITGERERKPTEELLDGQAFETLYQRGGDAFAEEVAVRPAHLDGRTKEGKAWAAAQQDKYSIDDAKYQAWLSMCGALNECADGRALIEHAESQVTIRGEAFGLPMQARPDWVVLDDFRPVIIDLKTTKAISDLARETPRGVFEPGPDVWKYGYHTQLALMRRLLAEAGYPNAACYLFAAEKTGLRSACIELPDWILREGEKHFEQYAPRLAECLRTGHFPRAVSGIVKLETPRWMAERQEIQP
jgi:PDDEXK-like domain of unknown function (DUF3799)